jgi:YegS/Rv2252/BmrU family lipid kinase
MAPVEHIVLVNPRAGRRPVVVDAIDDALARTGLRFRVEVVDGIDQMRSTACDVVRGGRTLVVAGGDGTVGSVAAALHDAGLAADAPALGILPVGTGCDLLRTFGIGRDLVSAAARLATPGDYRIDLGRVSGEFGRRIFVNIAQAGIGAAAAESATNLPRRLGLARYPLAFARRFATFPRAQIEIESTCGVRSAALAVIMANGQFFAGGWNVAPKALMVDGKLDVQVIDAKKWQAPALVPKIVAGTHLRDRAVTRRSIAAFRLRTDPAWPVEADGDHVGSTPVDVDTIPAAITIKI